MQTAAWKEFGNQHVYPSSWYRCRYEWRSSEEPKTKPDGIICRCAPAAAAAATAAEQYSTQMRVIIMSHGDPGPYVLYCSWL